MATLPATSSYPLLESVTVTGAGPAQTGLPSKKLLTASVTGTGAVTATINIECANRSSTWITLGTITLSGTTSAADGFFADSPCYLLRANVTAISGTGATVSADVGV
jgi:hypothetical protein